MERRARECCLASAASALECEHARDEVHQALLARGVEHVGAEVDEEAAVDVPAPAAEVDELTKAESLGRGAAKVR